MNSDQNFVGVQGGGVVRARALLRLAPEYRWDVQKTLEIGITPLTESSRYMDSLESLDAPHEHPAPDVVGPDAQPQSRRVKIMLADLRRHGFKEGCPGAPFSPKKTTRGCACTNT